MARAAEPRGENMPLVRREKGEEAGGRAQGREGAGFSSPRPVPGSPVRAAGGSFQTQASFRF